MIFNDVYLKGMEAVWPVTDNTDRLARLIAEICLSNGARLYLPFEEQQFKQGPWLTGLGSIFTNWLRHAQSSYLEYCEYYPKMESIFKQEASAGKDVQSFFADCSRDARSRRLGWDIYLKAPVVRLQRYSLMLGTAKKTQSENTEEFDVLTELIAELKSFVFVCDEAMGQSLKRVELDLLSSELRLEPAITRDIDLQNPQRTIMKRGDLQSQKIGGLYWIACHAVLLDNYLLLLRPKASSKSTHYEQITKPYPVELLSIPPVTWKFAAKNGRETMYPVQFEALGRSKSFTYYTSSLQNRHEWKEAILSAKEKLDARRSEINPEPFGIQALFTPLSPAPSSTNSLVPCISRECALFSAVNSREDFSPVKLEYGPFCASEVTNRRTEEGYDGPRIILYGMQDSIMAQKLPKMDIIHSPIRLEIDRIEFLPKWHLVLYLSNNTLYSERLNSRWLNLDEPGFDLHEKEVNHGLTDKKPSKVASNVTHFASISRDGPTLRIICSSTKMKILIYGNDGPASTSAPRLKLVESRPSPEEISAINTFRSSFVVTKPKWFEAHSMSSSNPFTVPVWNITETQPSAEAVALRSRVELLRPLGFLRRSEDEFLAVYEECALFVNKLGDLSRPMSIEFVGRAKTATISGEYLMLFNDSFIEIRHSNSGVLEQIVEGADLRLLDGGNQEFGTSVKFSIAHPLQPDRTFVGELILNETQI